MELTYKLIIEDYVDFNINLMETTAKYKLGRLINRCLALIILVPAGIYFTSTATSGKIITFSMYAGIGLVWFFTFSRFERWNIKKNFIRFTNKDKNYLILGTKHFTLSDTSITLRTGQFTEVNNLCDVSRITSDAHHYFIYIGNAKGMPVPFRYFASVEKRDEFYTILCDKVLKAGGKIQ